MLAKRFQVGRSTFREAVRTLEFFGMATVQRGSGGGLSVIEPDPSMVIETAVLYLQYFGLQSSSIESLADWLQGEMARMIGARATHQELHTLVGEIQNVTETPPRARAERVAQVVRQWGPLADNRVLSLMNEIVVAALGSIEQSSRTRTVSRDLHRRTLTTVATELRKATAGPSVQALTNSLFQVAKALRC